MKNKFMILLCVVVCLLLVGCDSTTTITINNETTSDNENMTSVENNTTEPISTESNTVAEEPTTENVETEEPTTSKPTPTEPTTTQTPTEKPTVIEQVEIVLTMVSFDANETITSYVNKLNADSNNKYYVYDETHYAYKVDKSEQINIANEIISEKGKKNAIAEMNSSYPNVFKDITYKNNGGTVVITADKELFDAQGFGIYFYAPIVSMTYGDTLQAYNLIPVSQRQYNAEIIDYLTSEVIYKSN